MLEDELDLRGERGEIGRRYAQQPPQRRMERVEARAIFLLDRILLRPRRPHRPPLALPHRGFCGLERAQRALPLPVIPDLIRDPASARTSKVDSRFRGNAANQRQRNRRA
jgi:hypothetical protein